MTTSALRRQVKNIVHNYSEAEIKVREATSNDPWGPSSSLMSEIADLTFNVVAFAEVMGMVWKRLNDSGKNWRHVYKALTLLDYLLKTGSERVAQQCRENAFTIQTLRDFQYIDRDGRDQGANVREKARQLVCLLRDEERLRQERSQALKTKERMAGGGSGGGGGVYGGIPPSYHPGRRTSQPSMAVLYGEEFSRSRGSPCSFNSSSSSPHAASDLEQARPQTSGEEELQLQLALAMSREESQKEQRCRQGDESLLQKALDESRRESQSGTRESAMLDLVDIFGSSSEPPPSSTDPWNSVQTNSDMNSDTWDAVAVHSSTPVVGSPWATPQPPNTSNPWAPCTKPHTDPWEPVPVSSSPVNHEWDSPTDPTTGCEVADLFMAQDMEKPKQDVPQVSSPQPASPTDAEVFGIKTESDPFSGPESKADVFGTEPVKPQVNGRESTSPEMFDLSHLAPPLSAPPARVCRTPEAFLGPTGASLVNLDALIPTNPPSKMHNNPFLSGLSAPSPTNPFHCDQPRLTLNQMRPSSTSPLPPHMLSYSPSLPLPLPHQTPTLPSSLTQPPAGLLDLPSNLPQPLIPLCPRPAARTQSQTHTHSHNPFL
ncbi:epsin-3 [Betta splendens]|uniref:Epsin-3 n=1 Tax=Betta splendens TaxID=158456 RepID=A0A6P7MEU9_BETSP|nr:epsin-3 [Betta splendens]XP_029005086.1 epsin-3 [Betta splendens]XP_029005095.1 epsin-3 [Betta splendens]XP_055365578.1 epsin-3 [Betta splendens]XP_055365587.1 epsin-3 [Betta splendens]